MKANKKAVYRIACVNFDPRFGGYAFSINDTNTLFFSYSDAMQAGVKFLPPPSALE